MRCLHPEISGYNVSRSIELEAFALLAIYNGEPNETKVETKLRLGQGIDRDSAASGAVV